MPSDREQLAARLREWAGRLLVMGFITDELWQQIADLRAASDIVARSESFPERVAGQAGRGELG